MIDPEERISVPVGYLDGLRRGWLILAVTVIVLIVVLGAAVFVTLPGWLLGGLAIAAGVAVTTATLITGR